MEWQVFGNQICMLSFIRHLLVFIKGSVHYGIINRGPGDFARVPVHRQTEQSALSAKHQ